MLPVGPLPPELEGMKELQGREVRVISGSMTIVDSVVRGTIRHGSPQGLLVVKGPVTFSGTRFEEPVDLSRSVFTQPVTLSGAVFLQESYFVQGRFLREVFAEKTSFGPHTRFHRSVFQGPVTFQQSRFNGLAEFLEVGSRKMSICRAPISNWAPGFPGAAFKVWRISLKPHSTVDAFFTFTLFEGDADFRRATFRSTADFSDARSRDERTSPKASFEKGPQFTSATDRRPDRRPQASKTRQYNMQAIVLPSGVRRPADRLSDPAAEKPGTPLPTTTTTNRWRLAPPHQSLV